MEELIELLRGLEAGRFYGTLELKYEAGRITWMKKSETMKPSWKLAEQPVQQNVPEGA